jgi:outer membrane autotransporter protein
MVAIVNLIILATSPAAMAESGTRSALETEFIVTGGYRNDELDWNIAGDINGNNPNVVSELTWDDLESYQLKFQGGLVWPNLIAVRGSLAYGWLFDGKNQDSDYLGDNRTFEFSRSNNTTDEDEVWDASLAVGYPARFGRTVIATVTPLVGYSHHEQQLNISDGYQTIPSVGPFEGLDSSYDTKWKGPWIGIDMHFKAAEIKSFAHRFETYLTYEYHWADFEAEANWNLRDDLAHPKSFSHDTNGNGFVIGAGINYRLTQHWALNFNFDYQDWSTDSGTIKFFLADGTTHKQQLNEVNWTSYAFMMGLSLRF